MVASCLTQSALAQVQVAIEMEPIKNSFRTHFTESTKHQAFFDVRFLMFDFTSAHLHRKPHIEMDKLGRFW